MWCTRSRAGDYLDIAKRYGVSRDEIVKANALTEPDKLALNRLLVGARGKPSCRTALLQLASRGAND